MGGPILAKREATTVGVAAMVHKNFARDFDFADGVERLVKDSRKSGEKFLLRDRDAVELHVC